MEYVAAMRMQLDAVWKLVIEAHFWLNPRDLPVVRVWDCYAFLALRFPHAPVILQKPPTERHKYCHDVIKHEKGQWVPSLDRQCLNGYQLQIMRI